MDKQYYIIRGDRSGVFFGTIKRRAGQEVEIENARRLWFWSGAASLSQLAAEGVKNPRNCKFTVTVPSIVVLDAIELIPCQPAAVENIKGVQEWKM